MFELISYLLLLIILALNIHLFKIGLSDRRGRRNLVSCNSMVAMLCSVYIVMSAAMPIIVDNFDFTWAPRLSGADMAVSGLLVNLLGVGSYLLAYKWFTRSSVRTPVIEYEVPSGKAREYQEDRTILIGMVALGALIKLYLLYRMGGVTESVVQMSSGMREMFGLQTEGGTVGMLRSLGTMGDMAATVLLVRSIARWRQLEIWGSVFVATLMLTYLNAGKRTLLVEFLVIAVVAYGFYRKKLDLKYAPHLIFGALFFGWITLWIRSFLAVGLSNIAVDLYAIPWAKGSAFRAYFFSLEFAFFETTVLSVAQAADIVRMFGGALNAFYTTNVEPLFLLIPRAIWPGKPDQFFDLSHGIAAVMFDNSLTLSAMRGGVAPSYIGTSWILGGVIGVVVYSTLIAFIGARADLWFKRLEEKNGATAIDIIIYGFAIFTCFVLWRQGGIGYTFISLITNQIGAVVGVCALIWLKSASARRDYLRVRAN